MRWLGCAFLLVVAVGLRAQLGTANGVDPIQALPVAVPEVVAPPPVVAGAFAGPVFWRSSGVWRTPGLRTPPPAQPAAFDFSRTAPHLAFFCRLEINEAAGNIIPVKFRLGGHRYWQDELLRR